jgi:pantetheine-phosphate adenylyltransferase
MTRAVCPGSFDPLTHGHLDVIERTARLVDSVVVAVGTNVAKRSLFSADERLQMLRSACARWDNVEVALFEGLLVYFCNDHDVNVISKGVRAGDFGYELQMAQMNRELTGIDTVFLPTAPRWSYVSSSLVREIATLGGDVSEFLPASVVEQIVTRVRERAAETAPPA